MGAAGPAALAPPRRGREAAATLAALAVIVPAVPAALLVVPDTSYNVIEQAARALGLDAGGLAGLLRATGMSVPVLLGSVPVGAVAARRFGGRPILAAGLALLVAGLLAAARADSVVMIGAVRAAQGAGAGLVLPATLVLAWERGGRLVPALWSGMLVASLLGAMPLALSRVPLPGDPAAPGADQATSGADSAASGADSTGSGANSAASAVSGIAHAIDWHAALAPFPWFAAAVAVGLPFCLLLRGRSGRLPALRHPERGQLVLPLVPAAGFAFIAVVTTYGWSPGGCLLLAGLALLGLAGLALVGTRDATAGSPLGAAVVMVTTGLLAYPVAAPLAGIAATAARNGTGASFHTYLPFAVGAGAALAAALLTSRLPEPSTQAGRLERGAVLGGQALMVLAAVPLLIAPVQDARVETVALAVLGAGAGTALAASLRGAEVAAALFGLSLCVPAVLAGQLVVLSLQAQRLRPAPTTAQAQLAALADGYRTWLGVAAVLAVLLAAAGRAVVSGRGRAVARRSRAGASVQ
ncbi:hypothetical protein [Actinomadura gamaensis]|uniref:MFS transporter n=1 Tax=Actinomadura gamaensis TaxID=1763541 RepID=A0ABV9U7K5_9ACTN